MTPELNLQIRQRSDWEAVDLGFAMVRSQPLSIYPAWMVFTLLCAALIWSLVPSDYLWLAGLLFWWLKPLFDRILLYGLARQVFDTHTPLAETFTALPGLLRTGLVSALTWRRLSPSRSYALPLWQLEGLRGTARKQRQEQLYLQGHGSAIGLTFACLLLETILYLSCYGLLLALDPTGEAWKFVKGIFTTTSTATQDASHILELLDFAFQVLAVIIIGPFYVAAGFSLYLNRRTQLEAWDIELALRGLGERLRGLAAQALSLLTLMAPALLLGAALLLPPAPVGAAETLNPDPPPVEASETVIKEVMQLEELSQRQKILRWLPRDKKADGDRPTPQNEVLITLLSRILKNILWGGVLLAILLALIFHRRILALLKPLQKTKAERPAPEVLFGLDIRPDSLPEELVAASREHWRNGRGREALSLLYRGALMHLTRKTAIQVRDSHTEGDILRLARPQLEHGKQDYLTLLTRNWQAAAYAHQLPPAEIMETLFSGWPAFSLFPPPEDNTPEAAA